jgi:integrase
LLDYAQGYRFWLPGNPIMLLNPDSGIRRAEACALNWSDVDISSGLARITKGKGGKYRSVVIGATTRRAILAYRRTAQHNSDAPILQTMKGTRLSPGGLRSAFLRIEKRTGILVTPHALRRTFATLSRRAGIDLMDL